MRVRPVQTALVWFLALPPVRRVRKAQAVPVEPPAREPNAALPQCDAFEAPVSLLGRSQVPASQVDVQGAPKRAALLLGHCVAVACPW
jgi:hypothetical protein